MYKKSCIIYELFSFTISKWLREFINNLELELDKAKDKLSKDILDVIEMDEAQSRSCASLLATTNLLFGKVQDEFMK